VRYATKMIVRIILAVSLAFFPIGSSTADDRPRTKRWTFAELLRPPAASELRRVDQEWARKSWEIGDIELAGSTTVPVAEERFDAHLYTFTLNGSPRCGAVLLPQGADDAPLAGLVDIGDIRWDYPARDLTAGPYVGRILETRARDFALIVPCSRGMGLRIGEVRVESGGDRRDAWEGDAEDAIAFLTVALSKTPRIDRTRLAAYGNSRGGGVALIVGQRDPRIKAVLAFAAPTDWFAAMARPGEKWAERLERAWNDTELPRDTRESQFLDFFVRDRQALPMAELRRRLIAASPLYFVAALPPVQVHHGRSDVAVPVRNAIAIRERLKATNSAGEVYIYDSSGHLLDGTEAFKVARAFLVERLGQRR
jgi:fermentation-respiration switch protein FrsA (DUF1100 family)